MDLEKLISDINKSKVNQSDINEISKDILNHFSYVSGIDLDEYVYKDDESIYPNVETEVGEVNEQEV